MILALVLAVFLTPTQITDLRVSSPATMGTGIAWHLTVPAVNDSACGPDELGEVVCTLPHRYAPATDTIQYHWAVWGLPPPFLPYVEDSTWVARGQRVSGFYPSWVAPWRRSAHLTQHWFSRAAVWPMEPHRVESVRVNKLLLITNY